jgi:hypothetical protein
MKLLLYSVLLGLIVSGLSLGQVTLTQAVVAAGPLQTGFAVVTPVGGTGAGLGVSETFGQQIGTSLFQASVLASPPVTLTDIVLNVNPQTGSNTGVAIVNPNGTAAVVTLNAGNQQGATIATRTITIGPQQQISDFVTELFPGNPNIFQGVTGLLFIGSNVPIGVVGLAFSGGTFTSLPVAAQLVGTTAITTSAPAPMTITTPATATITAPVTVTSNGVTITAPIGSTSFSPVTPSFNGIPTPPTLLPPPTANTPPGTGPITGSANVLVTSTGTATAFAPSPLVATTTPVGFLVPQLSLGVGGTGALLLPQVATGGGWISQITISNTSTVALAVRVDFFNPTGGPLATSLGSTIPSVVIAPGGVATLTP